MRQPQHRPCIGRHAPQRRQRPAGPPPGNQVPAPQHVQECRGSGFLRLPHRCNQRPVSVRSPIHLGMPPASGIDPVNMPAFPSQLLERTRHAQAHVGGELSLDGVLQRQCPWRAIRFIHGASARRSASKEAARAARCGYARAGRSCPRRASVYHVARRTRAAARLATAPRRPAQCSAQAAIIGRRCSTRSSRA